MYKYFHDEPQKIVYKVPAAPIVHEQRDKKGKLVSRNIYMAIDITRADNVLRGNQWKYPTSLYPKQYFDNRYEEEEALHYFKLNNEPDGVEISEAEYLALAKEYDDAARRNRD